MFLILCNVLFCTRNFQFASKLRSEGIYMVNPSSERPNPRKPSQPVKVMSIDGLKRALRYVKHYLICSICLVYWSSCTWYLASLYLLLFSILFGVLLQKKNAVVLSERTICHHTIVHHGHCTGYLHFLVICCIWFRAYQSRGSIDPIL